MDATTDGRFLVFAGEGQKAALDLYALPRAGGAEPLPLVPTPIRIRPTGRSPDGRWLAYVSSESGTNEVFVRPLTTDPATGVPVPGGQMLVSNGGGVSPRWRRDARELFYQGRGGAVMAVTVDPRRQSIYAHRALSRARHPGNWSVRANGRTLSRRRAEPAKCAGVYRRPRLAVGAQELTRDDDHPAFPPRRCALVRLQGTKLEQTSSRIVVPSLIQSSPLPIFLLGLPLYSVRPGWPKEAHAISSTLHNLLWRSL